MERGNFQQAFASSNFAPRRTGRPELMRFWSLEALADTCDCYRTGGVSMLQLLAKR